MELGAALPEIGVPDQPVIEIGIHEIRVQAQSNPAGPISLSGQETFDRSKDRWGELVLTAYRRDATRSDYVSNLKKSEGPGWGEQHTEYYAVRLHVTGSSLQCFKTAT